MSGDLLTNLDQYLIQRIYPNFILDIVLLLLLFALNYCHYNSKISVSAVCFDISHHAHLCRVIFPCHFAFTKYL